MAVVPLKEHCSAALCKVEGTVGEELVLIQVDDPITGRKRQVRCKTCNSAMGRLKRFLKDESEAKALYSELDKEGKHKFLNQIAESSLVGPKIKSLLTETVTWVRIHRKTTSYSTKGEFFTEKCLREDKDLDEDDVKAIMEGSHNITCQITGKKRYWKPSYEMEEKTAEEDTEQKKREVESEQAIKAPKQKKAKKALPDRAADDVVNPDQEKQVPVTEGQRARLTKIVQKFEEQIAELAGRITEASAPDCDFVAKKVIDKAEDVSAKVEVTVREAKGIIEKGSFKKGNGFHEMPFIFSTFSYFHI